MLSHIFTNPEEEYTIGSVLNRQSLGGSERKKGKNVAEGDTRKSYLFIVVGKSNE